MTEGERGPMELGGEAVEAVPYGENADPPRILIGDDQAFTELLMDTLPATLFERLEQAWQRCAEGVAIAATTVEQADTRCQEAEKQFRQAVTRNGKTTAIHLANLELMTGRIRSYSAVIEVLGGTIQREREISESMMNDLNGQVDGMEQLLRDKGLLQ